MSFRKRLQKTSAEQYEEYLKMMEEDELFRSSTNDPTIDPKYIESCWQKLMLRLNSCSSGPTLTIGEWKKVNKHLLFIFSKNQILIAFQ